MALGCYDVGVVSAFVVITTPTLRSKCNNARKRGNKKIGVEKAEIKFGTEAVAVVDVVVDVVVDAVVDAAVDASAVVADAVVVVDVVAFYNVGIVDTVTVLTLPNCLEN